VIHIRESRRHSFIDDRGPLSWPSMTRRSLVLEIDRRAVRFFATATSRLRSGFRVSKSLPPVPGLLAGDAFPHLDGGNLECDSGTSIGTRGRSETEGRKREEAEISSRDHRDRSVTRQLAREVAEWRGKVEETKSHSRVSRDASLSRDLEALA